MKINDLSKGKKEDVVRDKFVSFFKMRDYKVYQFLNSSLYKLKKKGIFKILMTDTIFFYDDWVHIKMAKDKFKILKNLLDEFERVCKIRLEIEIY